LCNNMSLSVCLVLAMLTAVAVVLLLFLLARSVFARIDSSLNRASRLYQ
jgi:hypothetical protein